MKNNRLRGFIVFIIAILLVGGLTYYEFGQLQPKETVVFSPAESDDLAPPGDQPIVPPAELTEGQPAAGAAAPAPAAETTAPTDNATAEATANPPAAPAVEAPATPAAEAPASATPPADQGNAAPPAAGEQVATAEPSPGAAAPTEPAEAAPGAAPTPVVPTFDVVRVEPTGETVVAGQAAPDAKVEVLDGAAAIATATANDRGEWAMALDNALPPGTHDLAIRTTSKDGAVSTLSDQRVAVEVPEPGSKDVLVVMNSPDQPSRVLELPKAGEPAAPGGEQVAAAAPQPAAEAPAEPETPKAPGEVAALEPPAAQPGTAAPAPAASAAPEPAPVASAPAEKPAEPAAAAEAAPPAQPAAPATPTPEVAVSAVEADTAGTLFIAGTAATGQTVRVYLNDRPLGEATPSPSGTWLVEVHHEVAPGTYSVRADQLSDPDGSVIARAEVPFERKIDVAALQASGTTGAAAGADLSGKLPEVQTVIIKRGDNLWNIARTNWGTGIRWSTLYQANKDQIRNPHWIYPGQVFIMPVSPDVAKN